jgi:hypothetical protein
MLLRLSLLLTFFKCNLVVNHHACAITESALQPPTAQIVQTVELRSAIKYQWTGIILKRLLSAAPA